MKKYSDDGGKSFLHLKAKTHWSLSLRPGNVAFAEFGDSAVEREHSNTFKGIWMSV